MIDARITAAGAAKYLGISLQAVHKRLNTKNIPYSKSHNRIYFGHESAKQLFDIQFTKKIRAFMNIKGGVGKGELCYDNCVGYNLYGSNNLLCDFDLQANQTRDRLGLDASEKPVLIDCILDNIPVTDAIIDISPGFDLFPSRIENCMLESELMAKRLPLDKVIRDRFRPLLTEYDNIFIDCSPAFGGYFTAIALAVDEIIVPVTPDTQSFAGLEMCFREIKKIEEIYKTNIPIRVVFNKFELRKKTSYDELERLITHPVFGPLRYKTYIKLSQEFPNAFSKGETIFKTLRDSQAREDIDSLVTEMIELESSNIMMEAEYA